MSSANRLVLGPQTMATRISGIASAGFRSWATVIVLMFGSVFDCNPVPHGATNRLLLENFQQATHIGWLGVPVGSGDRVKRRSSENSAPSGFSARPKMR